jgi:hypothetical protein
MVQRFWGGGVEFDSGMGVKKNKKRLDLRGPKADMYYNFSQLRLGDPKGLPSFFCPDSVAGAAILPNPR